MVRKEDTFEYWLNFWRMLEIRKGIQGKTPPFPEDLISWLFRELHTGTARKPDADSKFTGINDETKGNDRIAIGIPREIDGKVTRTAFAPYPDKSPPSMS